MLYAAGPSAAQLAPSFAASISLDLFTPHYASSTDTATLVQPDQIDDDENDESEPSHYTHPCRCSGTFTITTAQLEQGIDLIQCDGCTERCRVEYEVVEEEDGAEVDG